MRLSRSGNARADATLYEEIDEPGGTTVYSYVDGATVTPTAAAAQFYAAATGTGATVWILGNGVAVRRLISTVAVVGAIGNNKVFPLRRRVTAAPIIPLAYRFYRRYTYEATIWRNQLTALVAYEHGLAGNETQLPGEAFVDEKVVFRSVLAEFGGNWQTSYRLADGGAVVRADTGVSPLTPARAKWVFETGPNPQLRVYLNDVLRLTMQDGTAIVLPTAKVADTPAEFNFCPGLGMDGAIGDEGYSADALYRVERL